MGYLEERQSRLGIPRGQGAGRMESLFDRDSVCWEDEEVLEIGGGDGYTAVWMHSMPLNCPLRDGQHVKYQVCISHSFFQPVEWYAHTHVYVPAYVSQHSVTCSYQSFLFFMEVTEKCLFANMEHLSEYIINTLSIGFK